MATPTPDPPVNAVPSQFESLALWGIICVAVAALAYAATLA